MSKSIMKDKIIKDLIEANRRLLKVIAKMPDEEKVDQWTKREILAHIAGWYEEGLEEIPKILKGETPISFRFSIDGYNKRSVEKRKNKNVPQILSEMTELHNQLIKQIRNLNDKQIVGYYGTKLGKKPRNIIWMINECISHDNDHALELEQKYE